MPGWTLPLDGWGWDKLSYETPVDLLQRVNSYVTPHGSILELNKMAYMKHFTPCGCSLLVHRAGRLCPSNIQHIQIK